MFSLHLKEEVLKKGGEEVKSPYDLIVSVNSYSFPVS